MTPQPTENKNFWPTTNPTQPGPTQLAGQPNPRTTLGWLCLDISLGCHLQLISGELSVIWVEKTTWQTSQYLAGCRSRWPPSMWHNDWWCTWSGWRPCIVEENDDSWLYAPQWCTFLKEKKKVSGWAAEIISTFSAVFGRDSALGPAY